MAELLIYDSDEMILTFSGHYRDQRRVSKQNLDQRIHLTRGGKLSFNTRSDAECLEDLIQKEDLRARHAAGDDDIPKDIFQEAIRAAGEKNYIVSQGRKSSDSNKMWEWSRAHSKIQFEL